MHLRLAVLVLASLLSGCVVNPVPTPGPENATAAGKDTSQLGAADIALGADTVAWAPDVAAPDAALADTSLCVSPVCAACEANAAAIAAEINAKPQGCAAVVRLAWDTDQPQDWQLFCAPYADVTETSARAAAAKFGALNPAKMRNDANPSDVYVFRVEPTDLGSLTVVSAHTGLLLLGVQLNWSAKSIVQFPAQWRDPSTLGAGCKSAVPMPPHRVYDFAGDSLPPTAAEIDKALAAVAGTPLFAAFTAKGVLQDVVLVRVQRSVNGSSRATSAAEWVAIVQGGAGE